MRQNRNFLDFVYSSSYITISKTQQKKANKMYVDTKEGETKQIGWVFIGSTEIDFGNQWRKDLFLCGYQLTSW